MLRSSQILVRTIALAASVAGLGACGQRGPLYLPQSPAASQRATLTQTLTPGEQQAPVPAPTPSTTDTSATP